MPAGIALATLVLRLLTAATGPTDWDSAQYGSAVHHFDVTHGEPQPPGYWLYVESGRIVTHLTGLGTIRSLVVVAALASALGAGLAAVAGRDLGGWWVGLAAGIIIATSPFAWFSGSVVATYSFDMVACPLLIILAWRARPGSWHGVAAAGMLGLLAGFRQSILQSFLILGLIAVVGSTRRWSRLGLTVLAGVTGVAVWFVPMIGEQPGGYAAWARATRSEAIGAVRSTSVLDHATAGSVNLGTFAGYTIVALAPLALLTVLATAALGIRRLVRSTPPPRTVQTPRPDAEPHLQIQPPEWIRPWFQSRAAILAAAVVPPMVLVSLVEFAKGGYLLAYFPAVVIVLLLPVAALVRPQTAGGRTSAIGLVVISVGVALVALLGVQRFASGDGVLPQRQLRDSGSLWLVQPRYQAPYADTWHAIRTADDIDAALRGLGPSIRSGRDVVALDTPDGGATIYRNAGWALPDDRVTLIGPGQVLYNQLHGALYYSSGTTVPVGPGGSLFLVASPALPGLAALATEGYALPVITPRPIGGYGVWQILPGVGILGIHIVEQAGPRLLGTGI
jgi:hypothetical protein